jgi:hypothetical protein
MEGTATTLGTVKQIINIIPQVPATTEVETKAVSLVEQAGMVKITDPKSYEVAGFLWKTIGEVMKEVSDTFDPLIEAAHRNHKLALEKKAKFYSPLDKAKRDVKGLMSNYEQEQERIRLEKQREIEAKLKKEEEDRLLQEAEFLAANGMMEEAEQVIQEPVYTPPVVLPKETPKVKGVSFRTIYDFEIVNASLIPRQFLSPDLVKIGGVVRSLKEATQIPGVKVFSRRV